MAIKAQSNNLIPEWFTPSSQADDPDPTRFKIRPLTGLQHMEIMMYVEMSTSGDLFVSAKGMEMALKYGLVEWDNFNDEAGEPIACIAGNFGRLPSADLAEIGRTIINRSSISGEQEKN